ncbi:Uncharacterised protein [Mycoplasmoides gallisepticum]|uniref:Uncharacterized protein n=1 Tax=Mycoplasmoides gallisepticum TaxID=2096 RepID=A0A3B0PB82_MYCGL|nr:Uncharacterised protein [Mycoplasmoides gallisepticum]
MVTSINESANNNVIIALITHAAMIKVGLFPVSRNTLIFLTKIPTPITDPIIMDSDANNPILFLFVLSLIIFFNHLHRLVSVFLKFV